MKSVKFFLAGMYFYLLTMIAIPIGFRLFITKLWDETLALYIFATVLVIILGLVMAIMASRAYKRENFDALKKGWKLLKFASTPFYILNFFCSCFITLMFTGLAKGDPEMLKQCVIWFVSVTFIIIAECVCVGIFYRKYLHNYT